MTRVVVDPITRIEGHLRVEAELTDGTIVDAWSSGTAWRGLEKILVGRDPRAAWYFAQRICGVCTSVHALASVRAVEDALSIEPPPAARLLRDLIAASQFVHDHVVHFYHLHALDWVDVLSALEADPARAARAAASLSDHPRAGTDHLRTVRDRLRTFVSGGRLGPFANGYWGHPGYLLSPELNLVAVSHYFDALDFQRSYVQLHAILGGKNPHPQTYLVGGIAKPIDPSSQYALNPAELTRIRTLLAEGRAFVDQVYVPDALAIAGAYKEWFSIGSCSGSFLSAGDFEGAAGGGRLFPAGIVRMGKPGTVERFDASRIEEDVSRSWFEQDGPAARSPFEGESEPNYTGPEPPYSHLNVEGRYSWVKAPRYAGEVVEVGPAARLIVGHASGAKALREPVDAALATLGVGLESLSSTMGRTLARALETTVVARHADTIVDRLEETIARGDWRIHSGAWDPGEWPGKARGLGLAEAPRGTLSHWVEIEDRKLTRYQVVSPSTWNAGPCDAAGKHGPYELALIGTPVEKPEQPLEILRTLHSFDPCIACAAHLVDERGQTFEVKVQ